MMLPLLAVIAGLALLVWSADRFVDGAASIARHFGMPPLLIGMVIIGFGTSAPEIAVSVLASLEGSPNIALGNAFGSNITNIALILGLTAIISPIAVESKILRKELPILTIVTGIVAMLILDGSLSRLDGGVLLVVFLLLIGWSIYVGYRRRSDALTEEMVEELGEHMESPLRASIDLALGLALLVASSRALVWGAVEISSAMGISDLVIGLTVVAIGTSLPELATSVIATRKGEHDLALGNVLGSNLFNTLAVVGLAGAIHPLGVEPMMIIRDLPVMGLLTLSLFVLAFGFRGPGTGRINRFEGALLLVSYVAYTAYLIVTTV